MPDPSIPLRPADGSDLDRVEGLLEANDLPSADVRSKSESFFLARLDGDIVGVGGLEIRGENDEHGLLRSVVVRESHRGRGYGTDICDWLESRAEAAGVETLYLLTTTAAGFFRHRGYERIDRADAPPAIRETAEFADLCPASATCMARDV